MVALLSNMIVLSMTQQRCCFQNKTRAYIYGLPLILSILLFLLIWLIDTRLKASLSKRVTCNFPSIFFAPQNKNEKSTPPRHQGVDFPKPCSGPACFSSNFALFINIYGHIDMANKVSFGRRHAQLSTHFSFSGESGETSPVLSIAPVFVPKSCTHHLTHNNNNLLSHKEKKGKTSKQRGMCVLPLLAADRSAH